MNGPVYIVDDEETMRRALSALLRSADIRCRDFNSANAFLEVLDELEPGCLLLDLYMAGMTGLELQEKLIERQFTMPIIVITGHGDVETAVRAMKRGAADFVQKPFDPAELLDRLQQSMATFQAQRDVNDAAARAHERVANLTPREREIADQFLAGKRNKQVAQALSISVRTVELHRASIIRKLEATSIADAVHTITLAESLAGDAVNAKSTPPGKR